MSYTGRAYRTGFRPASAEEDEERMYQARYDYEAAREGDLSFTGGDVLEVIGPTVGTWWLARNTRTGKEGYIPYNFIKRLADRRTSAAPPPETGKVFTAHRDYKATFPSALSIKKNDKIEVLKEKDEIWVWGRELVSNLKGLVPRSFLIQDNPITDALWYYGTISRERAEALLLLPHNQTGAFLIRDSSQGSAGYSLSVRYERVVKHYLIHMNTDGRIYISQNDVFKTITELVHYYQSNSGLCTMLGMPCKNEPPPVEMVEGQWEIDRTLIVPTGEVLGEGQFGQVYKALWKKITPVAVKEMKHDCMNLKEFEREAETMQRLRHPRLVKLYGICTTPAGQPLLIVTEFVPNGSLKELLLKYNRAGTPLDPCTLVSMSELVASGMAYLEGEKVIHRDLAARNILAGRDMQVKIADFGLARFIKEDFYLRRSDIKFPVKWTAPEALVNNLYTTKSDVWSFGILLYEIFTHGGNPYPGTRGKEARNLIQDGTLNRQPSGCPDEVYNIMRNCWQMNPHNRPNFLELRNLLNRVKQRL
nr:tyrosine-protein kinase SRK3-like [Procambarus clarkii]